MTKPDQVKSFVIDTNVLIHNPEAIMSFRDNEIILPVQVLEELDRLKTYPDQRGKAAREAIRFLDALSRAGSLHEGVKLENGSILRVALGGAAAELVGLDMEKNDNKIIQVAYLAQREGKRVFFVSKDVNARVKAQALGLKTVDYEKQKIDIRSLYPGLREAEAGHETAQYFAERALIPWKDRLQPNEFVLFRDKAQNLEYLARYAAGQSYLIPVAADRPPVCGVAPLNMRQSAALELLLDDKVPLVTLIGKAGTGKTLLAIAAGLYQVLEEKKYNRVLVSRPVVPVGKDIGYLPGEKSAKMANWMEPIFDNLEHLLSVYKRPNCKTVEGLLKDKTIEIEALSLMRGRSLPRQFIVIDEAQNLTPHEVKTIVSRAGEGAKIVLTGDPYQIDNMYLDANSNGLTYLVEAFKGQALFGHVTLQKSERSELAELAAELL
jgi:PhoH-like ATPase